MRIKLGYSGTLILLVIITIVMWSWINPRLEKDGWKIGPTVVDYTPIGEVKVTVAQDPLAGNLIIDLQTYKAKDQINFGSTPVYDDEITNAILKAEADKKRLIMNADANVNEMIQLLQIRAMHDLSLDVPKIYLSGD